MKKLLMIPTVLLSVSSFLLSACGNASTETSMKSPIQESADSTVQKENKETGDKEDKENEKDENKSMIKETGFNESTNVKLKTIENMLAAFKGETTASAKYAAYSKKAEQEGYHEIALLFKAASAAENIHANNHKAVLQESGIATPIIRPTFDVLSTKENLEDAIKGESYEISTMYPEFLTTANDAGNQLALISLNYAYKTEKKHKVMYETALAALHTNSVKTLPSVFYICPTCGNTYETKPPARCGISMTSGERFITINSL